MHTINFKKYKRLFVFGCSFTSYRWPTWADILSQEIPDVDYYNFGLCGGGNLLMSIRITEANQRYHFTEDDLVVVMWTTFCREDRYKDGRWWNTGNIFTAVHDYPDEYVRKYADTKGYLIRDMAVITQTTAYLKSLPARSITLASVPYDHQQDMTDKSIQPILDLYESTVDMTPPDLFTLEMNGEWVNGHYYYNPSYGYPEGELTGDYHPSPLRYHSYLKKLGFPLTDASLAYAERAMIELAQTKTLDQLNASFPEIKQSKERTIL